MVKIKTKKVMNLPELIKWGWKNIEQVEGKEFKSKVRDSFGNYSIVQFSVDGYGFKTDGVSHKDLFTVKIEEEIAKCTKIPKLLAIFKYNENIYSEIHENKSINEILQLDRKLENSVTGSIHMFEDDDSLTLLWKNGKLVE